MAAACLVAAFIKVGTAAFSLVVPDAVSFHATCTVHGCAVRTDPSGGLPSEYRRETLVGPDALKRLVDQAHEPKPRVLLALASLATALPAAFTFWALFMAFRRFARGAVFGAQAIRWLGRASVGAALLAIADPVAATLRATALLPVLTGRDQLVFALKGEHLAYGLFFAAAAWVATQALTEGRQVRDDLKGYV